MMQHFPIPAPLPDALRRQRSIGHVALSVARMPGGATRTTDLAESGPLRLRLPRPEPGPMEAVLLNSAGGIACGDRFTVEASDQESGGIRRMEAIGICETRIPALARRPFDHEIEVGAAGTDLQRRGHGHRAML